MRPCPSSPLALSHSWLPSCSLHCILYVSPTLIFSRCRRPSKWIPLLSAVCLCKTSASDRASRREASWAQLQPCMRRRTFTASRDSKDVERFQKKRIRVWLGAVKWGVVPTQLTALKQTSSARSSRKRRSKIKVGTAMANLRSVFGLLQH